MNKLTEIKELISKHEKFTSRLEETRNPNKIDDTIMRQMSIEERAFAYIPYLLSLLEEKDKALQGQHRYFERISVTFGEFECQRLAKEAMEKYTSSNNEGENS